MKDKITKVLAYDGQVKIVVVEAKNTIAEAAKRHNSWHTATAALGRTMVGATLLASNLKGEEVLTVKIQGTGPLGAILVDADGKGNVRGLIGNPHVALELNPEGKLDVSQAVGLPGILNVKKFMGGAEPFIGQVALVSGEIAEDFTYYMAVSEQTPSSFGLSIVVNPDESVKTAGGYMLQLMPGAQEETIIGLEKAIEKLSGLAYYFAQENPVTALISALCPDTSFKVISENPVNFHCNCSRDRFRAGLKMLELEELMKITEEDKGAETVCHFCQEKYIFSEDELREIIQEKKMEGTSV